MYINDTTEVWVYKITIIIIIKKYYYDLFIKKIGQFNVSLFCLQGFLFFFFMWSLIIVIVRVMF